MKLWTKILLLTIIDYVVIWFFVRQMDPDPSISIAILVFVPFVFGLNIVIASFLYFTKRKNAKLFVINSVISAVLMFYIFGNGIDRHQQLRYESWTFKLNEKTYEITHSKLDKTFFISYSTNPGSSSGFLAGKFIDNKNEIYLQADTIKYTIRNGYLFGFTNKTDSIKLTKQER